ncbi:GNAT family N-acetyltransferase [Jannaschia sp. M317]|uniref:GNAT family N-acetyltransferase n=1 Tax=Jannaschia sp. M317 TaxID=2867011 RepID=UPI0021A7983F|nr:GNAT family N-acetyltransferase [Jannaschia sp. M317]UWQ19364.1 GNAT family N-acetyltransferase [Jannaschia sp. M317]
MIRALTQADAAPLRALWRRGLAEEPASFLLTPQELDALPDAALTTMLARGDVMGTELSGRLVALAILRQGGPVRLRHSGDLGPLYVAPDARGRGLGRALLQATLDVARSRGLLQVELCVDMSNTPAIALYEALGFTRIGLRPRSVILDGAPRDDILMLRQLDTSDTGARPERDQHPVTSR